MKNLALALAAALALSACASERVSHFPSYKLTVIQGNELSAETLDKLQVGMSKQAVRDLLGTAMLQDTFHQDRWDYPYVISRNGVVQENKSLTLYFNNDKLERIDNGYLQSEKP